MTAECEIDSCGVIAVGRCAECGKAMCTSHRAIGDSGRIILNQCTVCYEIAALAANEPHLQAAEASRRIEQAVRELKSLGYPESQTSAFLSTERKPFRGWVNVQAPGLRYWMVGKYRWQWSDGGTGDGYGMVARDEMCATLVAENASIYRAGDHGLAKGRPPSYGLAWPEHPHALAAIADRLEEIVGRHQSVS